MTMTLFEERWASQKSLVRARELLSGSKAVVSETVDWMLRIDLSVATIVRYRARWMVSGTLNGTQERLVTEIECLLADCLDALCTLTGFDEDVACRMVLDDFRKRDMRCCDWGVELGVPGRFTHLLDISTRIQRAVEGGSTPNLVDAVSALSGALLEAHLLAVHGALTAWDFVEHGERAAALMVVLLFGTEPTHL